MKQYKHPKLGREAKKNTSDSDFPDYFTIYQSLDFLPDKNLPQGTWYNYQVSELLALWFEEVKEELTNEEVLLGVEKWNTYSSGSEIKQEDWIETFFDEFSRFKTQEMLNAFRRVIEKHIRKQKKFTIQEVNDYFNQIGYEECLTDFLRDHDLLEE